MATERPKRDTVDQRISLDVRHVFREMAGDPRRRVTLYWNSTQPDAPTATVAAVIAENSLALIHIGGAMNNERLELTFSPGTYGGVRPWFLCPKLGCGRRVAVVYANGCRFVCRHCAHLVYRSHRERPRDRLLRKIRSVRARVGGGVNLLEDFPPRPPGMHRSTYDDLRVREGRLWGNVMVRLPNAYRSGKAGRLPRVQGVEAP